MDARILAASTARAPETGQVLAEAFDDDPLFRHLWPGPRQRRRMLRSLLTAEARICAELGVSTEARVAGRVVGSACWEPPAPRKTFRHFVDVFFEMIKSFTISEKEISRRLSITNPELLDPYYEKGQSVIFLSGHYANWEWVSFIVEKSLNYHMSVVYKRLKNKYFDQLMKKTRNRRIRTLCIRCT